ncbi:hypothetical protein AMELA_G00141490 [Ameiurus melas]|uniref:Uncharacterized protein n=1 Tax=Ameiurus melas TaxID=219545 RepID=A0A7J6AKK8_AMEME|nr:hypothetical protein AMELA_G00141490 [Ameiurus melas]
MCTMTKQNIRSPVTNTTSKKAIDHIKTMAVFGPTGDGPPAKSPGKLKLLPRTPRMDPIGLPPFRAILRYYRGKDPEFDTVSDSIIPSTDSDFNQSPVHEPGGNVESSITAQDKEICLQLIGHQECSSPVPSPPSSDKPASPRGSARRRTRPFWQTYSLIRKMASLTKRGQTPRQRALLLLEEVALVLLEPQFDLRGVSIGHANIQFLRVP